MEKPESSSTSEPAIVVKKKSGPSPLFLFATAILLCVTIYLFVIVKSRPKNGVRSPAVGKRLATLELKPLTGEARQLGLEDLPGRVTMINFWGTWCPPCVKEFPHMVALREELSVHDEFQFVSVSCLRQPNGNESALRGQTQTFMEYLNARLPTHSDLEIQTRSAVAATLDTDSLPFPATILIDRTGVVRALWLGYLPGDEKEMREVAMRALMEPDSI